MRGARAVKLDRVLACLWQQARIGGAVNAAACLRQPIENPRRGGPRIDLHALACTRQFVERRAEPVGRLDRDGVAEMAIETGGELAAVDEQFDAASASQRQAGSSTRWRISNSAVSTCAAACRV